MVTKSITLDKSTLLPASLVIALVLGASSLAWKTANTLNSIDLRLQRIEQRLDQVSVDRWTGTDQRVWALELREANTGLVIPSPSRILGP